MESERNRGGQRRPFTLEISESRLSDVLVAYEEMDNNLFRKKSETTTTTKTTTTKKRRFFK